MHARDGGRRLAIANAIVLSAACITLALAWLCVRYGTVPEATALLYGAKPAIAVVFRAFLPVGVAATPVAAGATFTLSALSLFFLKVGAILFGSGYVLRHTSASSSERLCAASIMRLRLLPCTPPTTSSTHTPLLRAAAHARALEYEPSRISG
jgi:hypothetical protein